MKTVLFLGAGATRAQYCAEDEKVLQDRLNQMTDEDWEILPPPLDTDFVSRAMERCENNFPCVRGYFEKKLGNDIFAAHESGAIKLGMEWVFVNLFSDAHKQGASQCAKIALHNLLVVYRKLISVSTMPLDPQQEHPLRRLIDRLRQPSGKPTIVTTNQDLVVENILCPGQENVAPASPFGADSTGSAFVKFTGAKTPPSQGGTSTGIKLDVGNDGGKSKLSEIYGLSSEPDELELWHDGKPIAREKFSKCGWPDIPILKLHGSFNLWYESASKTDPTAIDTPLYIGIFMHKIIPEKNYLTYANDKKRYFYPLVVPPVEEKGGHGLFGFLEPLWEKARRELCSCERLIVFGYGFPPSDKETEELFSRHLNSGVKEVFVIDPSECSARRLERLFKNREIHVPVQRSKCVEGCLDRLS